MIKAGIDDEDRDSSRRMLGNHAEARVGEENYDAVQRSEMSAELSDAGLRTSRFCDRNSAGFKGIQRR